MVRDMVYNFNRFTYVGIYVYISYHIQGYVISVCMNTFVLICKDPEGCFNATNFKAHSAHLWGFQ